MADAGIRHPEVRAFFDPATFSLQYVVADPIERVCAIIDPVWDYDERSGNLATRNADAMLQYCAEQGYRVDLVIDTHPHADHFSAARYISDRTGATTATGAAVVHVQALWRDIYNWPELAVDGSQWDRLFADGEQFLLGGIAARAIHSPGHTLASTSFLFGDAAFVHDTLFMPDSGTARADFPGGSAQALHRSISAILALPADTRLFTGHDYQPGGRELRWQSSIAEQRRDNPHLQGSEAAFVAIRQERDRSLPMPRLILHALQVNISGGRLPEPEANGRRYIKLPLGLFPDAPW